MKDITLHIGLPKTGTTSVQRHLLANRSTLAAQGICYPAAGCGRRIAHHDIADACKRFRPLWGGLRDLRTQFDAEVAPFDRVIVSSEGFQSVRGYPGVVAFFGAPGGSRRGACRIRTICYVREFLETASSDYAQKVQSSGLDLSFEDYCARRYRRPLWLISNFWRWFSDEAAFGHFDRSRLFKQDIVEDFFQRIGLPVPGTVERSDANPSISGNLLGFKLLLNRHGLHGGRIYWILKELALSDPAYRGRFQVTDADAARIRKRFAGYNRTVAGLVGEIPYRSFEGGQPLPNFDTWRADLERFLAHPELAPLKDRPEIRGATAEQVAAIARRRGAEA